MASHRHISQHKQRQIQTQTDDTCDIRAAEIQVRILHQKGTENLADTNDAAAVESRRNDKIVDADGVDQHTADGEQNL